MNGWRTMDGWRTNVAKSNKRLAGDDRLCPEETKDIEDESSVYFINGEREVKCVDKYRKLCWKIHHIIKINYLALRYSFMYEDYLLW